MQMLVKERDAVQKEVEECLRQPISRCSSKQLVHTSNTFIIQMEAYQQLEDNFKRLLAR